MFFKMKKGKGRGNFWGKFDGGTLFLAGVPPVLLGMGWGVVSALCVCMPTHI